MQAIILFIIMALAISTFGVLTRPDAEKLPGEASLIGTQEVSEEEEISQEEKQTQEQIQKSITQTKPIWSQKTKPITKLVSKPKKTEPVVPKVSINTYITSGPKEGEIINETNKVAFEFRAKVSPVETEGRITYETKVEEFDEDWKRTSSKKRTINLPLGPKEYTFLVRAKINNAIDQTPAKITFKINTSPYFGKVKISSARIKSSSRPSLITLSIYLGKEEEINITGWNIKGKKGSFVIPGGIEKYNPYSNPVPGENIFIKRGDIIYLSGASNPLGKGINFRPNKCLGYLTIYRDFPIPLSRNCPRPTSEEISHLELCCQEFIQDLGRCKIPNYSQDYSVARDSECVTYLNNNFSYGGCYRKYSRDEDFVENNWHIYMNREFLVSNDCDTLYLRDQNGLVIDKYSYGQAVCR